MLDRDKLAKILGLLGSNKPGEIVSAAHAAAELIRKANTSWAEVLKQNGVADQARAELAENGRLRGTAQQLLAANDALRKRVARRLAQRILDGAKQFHQTLLAFATAGLEFLRRQLAAYRHNRDSHGIRPVVIRSLLAAGILSTLGIAAILSLDDVTTLGEPSVRARTVAPSGQEAPEAAARSNGLPPQAERRATISNPSPIAAMATPELIPEPTPSPAVPAPVEDLTTVRATSPPAIPPGHTARGPEARSSVASSPAPAEKQVTPPTTSRTTSPPATQSLPNQQPSAEIAALVARGDALLSTGDIVSARLFYERAADRGDGGAALRLGATFDPGFLARITARRFQMRSQPR